MEIVENCGSLVGDTSCTRHRLQVQLEMVRIRGNLYLLVEAALVRSAVPRIWLVEAIDAFKIHDSLVKEWGRKPVVHTEHL